MHTFDSAYIRCGTIRTTSRILKGTKLFERLKIKESQFDVRLPHAVAVWCPAPSCLMPGAYSIYKLAKDLKNGELSCIFRSLQHEPNFI